jgi:CubicO group peptidase (beta-lactamase class C family)
MSQGLAMQHVPRTDWDRAPWNRWSFQHVGEMLPTVAVKRGGTVRDFRRAERDLDALPVAGLDGGRTTLRDFLEASFTDGLLVLRRGAVVYERYLNGMDERALHLSQSLAKSFAGVLAGILIGRGSLDEAAPVTDLLPELAHTAYRDTTIRHLLDMTSGVRFSEDYTDPNSHMGRLDVASGWKPRPDNRGAWPATVFELILSLREQEAEHGTRFAYRSIETDVLAFALERASGRRYAQLLSEELWQKLCMERDGLMTVDASGFALADGGLNACLRDYGRFGQAILDGGAGIIPATWIEATRNGDHARFGAPYTAALPDGAYRNQFWIEDRQSRNLMARGVFGQLIHIDWQHETVVVKLSSWPDFTNPGWIRATLAMVHRIGEALSQSG